MLFQNVLYTLNHVVIVNHQSSFVKRLEMHYPQLSEVNHKLDFLL